MKNKNKNKKKQPKETGVFWASRDKLCASCLDVNEDGTVSCELPPTHDYDSSYSVVYSIKHLGKKMYNCGCIVYHNKYYPEFKFPETMWFDFFNESIPLGQSLVKFTINRCSTKH